MENQNQNFGYQTDESGNLYDQNGNFVAYNGQYFVDQFGSVQIQNPNPSAQEVPEPESQNFLDTLINSITGVFKKKEFSGEEEVKTEIAIHKNAEAKFPSELDFSEDLKRFTHNLNHLGDLFFSDSENIKNNISRFKLFFIGKEEVVDFLDQLSTLLNSGIRLVDAVRILQSQSKNASLKLLLGSLADKMSNGKQLSESLADYDYIFPIKWVKLILAAEKSGKMAEVLTDLSGEEKSQMQFMAKVKGALIYPSILLAMAGGVFWLMMTKMVPSLEKAFGSTDKFPPLTLAIIDLSHYMKENYLLIVTVPVVLIFFLILLNSQFVTSQKFWDWISLRVPVFGKILFRKNLIIFADNFSLLLSSGVLASEALKIVAQVMPSILFRRELHKIRHGVENGKSISEMMGLTSEVGISTAKENFYFPLEVAQMIKIGEETGNTIEILRKIREVNANKLDNLVKNLTAMLEPIITIVIGLIVGTLLIAFMIPMMSSFQAV